MNTFAPTNTLTAKQKNALSATVLQLVKAIPDSSSGIAGGFTVPYVEKPVPTDVYIYAMYQSILSMHKDNPVKYPSMLELIYYISHASQQHCTGMIFYDSFKGTLKTSRKEFLISSGTDPSPDMVAFTQEMVRRLTDGNCGFNSIDLGFSFRNKDGKKSGHANLILMNLDTNTNTIYLSLYEPHGAQVAEYISQHTNNLMNVIAASVPNIRIVPRTVISDPRGLQAQACDRVGYCVVFSLLWLFTVLNVSVKTRHPLSLSEISYIEPALTNLLRTPSNIMKLAKNFAALLYNQYITLITRGGNEKFHDIYQDHFYDLLDYKGYPSNRPGLFSAIAGLSSIPAEYRHLKRLSDMASEETQRADDGTSCIVDENCMSSLCVNKKCVTREQWELHEESHDELDDDDYDGDRGTDGSICTASKHCMSSLCKNGRCISMEDMDYDDADEDM